MTNSQTSPFGPQADPRPCGRLAEFGVAGGVYIASTLPVLGGVWLGATLLPRQGPAVQSQPGFINSSCAWDGMAYARIAASGYMPGTPSDVAFFPAYPLLARGIMTVTGQRAEVALVLTSHLCLIGTMVLAAAYLRGRETGGGQALAGYVLPVAALWPTTFFLRMGYSDSLLLLLIVVALHAMEREWPVPVIALMIGAATATRPTGIALVPAFALLLWRRAERAVVAKSGREPPRTLAIHGRFAAQAAWLLPMACWGACAYMLYLALTFGDPLAFVAAQGEWTVRSAVSPSRELWALLTLEPFWSCYVPTSTAWWARSEPAVSPLFSLQFANPIYFGLAALLVGWGAWKGWLNEREWVLGAMLLLIPYVTHSYRAVMMGHARYAAVVFPAYIVLGQLAMSCPASLVRTLCGVSGFFLGMYSALGRGSLRDGGRQGAVRLGQRRPGPVPRAGDDPGRGGRGASVRTRALAGGIRRARRGSD